MCESSGGRTTAAQIRRAAHASATWRRLGRGSRMAKEYACLGAVVSENAIFRQQSLAVWNRADSGGALQESCPCEVCHRDRTQQAQFLLWPRINNLATTQTASADSYQESLRVPEQYERYALASVAAFWMRLVHGWKDRSWGDGGVCSVGYVTVKGILAGSHASGTAR